MLAAAPHSQSNPAPAVSEAMRRIAAFWGLTNARLGAILGLSEASASRLRAGAFQLDPRTKAFELAAYLVRLFRSLDSFTGGSDEASRWWLTHPNADLGGAVPLERIQTIAGLIEVCDHVDAIRSRT